MRKLNRNEQIGEPQKAKPGFMNKPSNLKIIAVDFDGTLVHNNYPFIENPNNRLLDYIREHFNEYIWILWTCRSGEQLRLAVEWLKNEQNIVFDYVNENVPWLIEKYGDTRKVYADCYLDDKNNREIGNEWRHL